MLTKEIRLPAPTIKQLICRSRGKFEAERFEQFELCDPKILGHSAKELLSKIQPSFGECAMLSSMWANYLKEYYSVQAIVVAGDFKISNKTIFKCKKNLPEPTKSGNIIKANWSGHCWLEIGDWIGDLSIFRTAYRTQGASMLKEFVLSNFGDGKGALIVSKSKLPTKMKYIPKYVLNDKQIDCLVGGMLYKIESDTY
jgi:hypothetical protein